MKKTEVTDWFFFAKSDIETARVATFSGIYHIACFHAQQAAEKLLKAFINYQEKPIPKTHSLLELYDLILVIISGIKQFHAMLNNLDKYYMPTRYPDALPGSLPEGLPSKDHAQQAVKDVEKLYNFISKLVEEK